MVLLGPGQRERRRAERGARSSAGIQIAYQRSARQGLTCQLTTLTSAISRSASYSPSAALGRDRVKSAPPRSDPATEIVPF